VPESDQKDKNSKREREREREREKRREWRRTVLSLAPTNGQEKRGYKDDDR
jgi:hypothetical protein